MKALLTYVTWGFTRNRARYAPVYLSIALMSMLIFFAVVLAPLFRSDLSNQFGAATTKNVQFSLPFTLVLTGFVLSSSQIALVSSRIQSTRWAEYRLLKWLGVSRSERLAVAVLECVAHSIIAVVPALVCSVVVLTVVDVSLKLRQELPMSEMPLAAVCAAIVPIGVTVAVASVCALRSRNC